jgi:hypothetical protein
MEKRNSTIIELITVFGWKTSGKQDMYSNTTLIDKANKGISYLMPEMI